jgi:hypothetical protein
LDDWPAGNRTWVDEMKRDYRTTASIISEIFAVGCGCLATLAMIRRDLAL